MRPNHQSASPGATSRAAVHNPAPARDPRPRGRALALSGLMVVTAMSLGQAPASAQPVAVVGPEVHWPVTGTTPLPDSAPDVLIIGDSTTVHMLTQFRAALAAQGLDATIDARSGRTTYEGRAVLARYDLRDFDEVVVLLGANGNRDNARRDMRALKRAGVDTMATVQAPKQRTVNRAVRRVFGAERIPWAGYAARRGIRTTDGKHYTRRDYGVRARYMARKIAARVS